MLDSLKTLALEVDHADSVVQLKLCNIEVMVHSCRCTSRPLIIYGGLTEDVLFVDLTGLSNLTSLNFRISNAITSTIAYMWSLSLYIFYSDRDEPLKLDIFEF
ncbi:hypothetical protein C5167_006126 [Papaver somniferum]|uniref:Uncharacterized protein n=1 Tax=Papaver somniferum TaxID=3469 RepID=A0A4Y7JCK1_PAPSO|nr:hypothetical protein C5167_006126 [Papaver somniferum]